MIRLLCSNILEETVEGNGPPLFLMVSGNFPRGLSRTTMKASQNRWFHCPICISGPPEYQSSFCEIAIILSNLVKNIFI
jgi:hypothetical protein